MTEAREGLSASRIARYKLAKDLADIVFRIVQMFLVLALVAYFATATKHWLPLTVQMILAPALLAYIFFAPTHAMMEFDKATEDGHPIIGGLVWAAIIAAAALCSTTLTFADNIVAEVNALTHPADATHVVGPTK